MEDFYTNFMEHFVSVKIFLELFSRLALNMFFAYIVIYRIYYKINRNREYLFTFFIFNLLIFFVSSLLSDVKMKTGFAFGLFAIFSILRYRTEAINIKEMTFLFISIIIAVINSTVTMKIPLVNIIMANVVIIGSVHILENRWLKNFNESIGIIYEKIELIQKGREAELIEDLKIRTNLNVVSYEVLKIDFLKDIVKLRVFYAQK